METLAVVIEVVLFYLIIRTTFRLLILFKTAKKVKETANKQELNPTTVKLVEEKKVHDEVCGATLTRSNSYILVKNDKEHYFCSWECRQKYLDNIAMQA